LSDTRRRKPTYNLDEARQALEKIKRGVARGIRKKLGSYQVDEIIAYTLRLFGNGMKVAIELALMAADAGLVRTDEDIVFVAGTAKGVDMALLAATCQQC
jgi:hypothetical protein